ncbi:hypothetical protein [Klebsiella grimontii]|uniref:hypothetical protein n=1 Tax=Klebsiella grimontii TaxID=2058152 RepID=UPI0012B85594|nr:hypothetical protein [Klebsiella grimontii]
MNEQQAYVFTIGTYILQNSNTKITDIFIDKHKEGITHHCGPDMERFQLCFEAAQHEEDKVMEFFTSLTTEDAGKLAEYILLFSSIFAMRGVNEVFTHFLHKDDII